MSVESLASNGEAGDRTPLIGPATNGRVLGTSVSESMPGVSPIISESEDSITVRRPLQFYRVDNNPDHDQETQATVNRYKYYNKLARGRDSTLFMPNHIVPSQFFLVIPIKIEEGKQSSIITIFSIWNTMMGTSLLSMPWAIQQAGFGMGIALIVVMAGLCLYTANRVMNSSKNLPNPVLEFTDVCHYYLGKPGLYISIIFSVVSLLGASIVYWVLMSNFLYNSVTFIYEKANHEFNQSTPFSNSSIHNFADVICPRGFPVPPAPTPTTTISPVTLITTLAHTVNDTRLYFEPHTDSLATSLVQAFTSIQGASHDHLFHKVWGQTTTVPFFLLLVLAPLINFKSPTFFTKFNALGTVSVVYIIVFISIKAAKWGPHVNFTSTAVDYTHNFHWTFPALTGTLSLALYIHNCVMSIVRNQKHPEHNGRDLSIAYICVAATYLLIGILFYAFFPLPKECIEDNLLNNFTQSDILTFVARIFLFFQMITVFPLLMYIMRVQLMDMLFGSVYPSLLHVMVMNGIVITFCILFAVFMPQIGTIIRFSGALCGLVYIFTLPCIIFILIRRQNGTLTKPIIIVHAIIIVLGIANFIGQFLIL